MAAFQFEFYAELRKRVFAQTTVTISHLLDKKSRLHQTPRKEERPLFERSFLNIAFGLQESTAHTAAVPHYQTQSTKGGG
jgi:hypothetical protein